MSLNSWWDDRKPDPPHPEPAGGSRKAKRNRVKLPRPRLDPMTLSLLTDAERALMRGGSKEKREGIEMCHQVGSHDWGRWETTYYMYQGDRKTQRYVVCRRCGEWGQTKR